MTDLCYICRIAPGTTRDHVFPQQLFTAPLPSTMITAPACTPCQDALRKDEEYFRFFVTGAARGHEVAKELWEGPVQRSLNRPKGRGFAKSILDSGIGVELDTLDGPEAATAYTADWGRFRPVFFKILRGLHWKHRKALLGDEVRFHVVQQTREHPLPEDLVMLIGESPFFKIGDVVWFSWACDEEDPRYSVAMVLFYGRAQFVISSSVHDL